MTCTTNPVNAFYLLYNNPTLENVKNFEQTLSQSDNRVSYLITLIRDGFAEQLLKFSSFFNLGVRLSVSHSIEMFNHLGKRKSMPIKEIL